MSDANNRLGNLPPDIALKFKEVSVMYYSNGQLYEAFSHPKKPEGVDSKSAYIDSGLCSAGLRRYGQMKGEHIHIF